MEYGKPFVCSRAVAAPSAVCYGRTVHSHAVGEKNGETMRTAE